MSLVESYSVGCYNCIGNGACGSTDQLYVNRDADEGHGDEH